MCKYIHLQYLQQPIDLTLYEHTVSPANFWQVHGSGKSIGYFEDVISDTNFSSSSKW